MQEKKTLRWHRIVPDPNDAAHYVDVAYFSAGCVFAIHVGKSRGGPPNQYFARLTTMGYNPDSKAPIPKPACVDVVKPFTFYTRNDGNAHNICVKNIIDWAGRNRKDDETVDRIYNKLRTYLQYPQA